MTTTQTQEASAQTTITTSARASLTLAASLLGFFIVIFDAVVVNVALPTVQREFGSGISGLQWVIDGYTLMLADFLRTSGVLSSRVGARLDGSINPDKVFNATFDLDHIAEAYTAMDERRAIKALVKVSELA